MNLVAVDIGNSRITCALFRKGMMVETWHHPTAEAAAAAAGIRTKAPDTPVAIGSVVPSACATLAGQLNSSAGLHRIVPQEQKLLSGVYETMGADRVANAVAGWRLYGGETAAIVIDLGTATTLTAVSPGGRFAGGLITLGLGKTFAALHHEAAQLPPIDIENAEPSMYPLSFDTEAAITSGTVLAHVGAVEHWIKMARRGLPSDSVTVATGGWSGTVARYTRLFDHVDPYLTLKGIYLIAEAEAAPAGRG